MANELRKRFEEDLKLASFADRTQEAYIRAVRQLAEHYWKPPDRITEEEVRQYFLYMKNVKQYARGTMTIALCGIKFFYEKTLGMNWNVMGLVRPPREKTLPVVLSIEEVRIILSHVSRPWNRVCLSTIYSCGLRLQEGTHSQIPDIDGKRGFIHIHRGKGAKDRYVPLPVRTLEMLREFWKTHRNPVWMFPAPGRSSREMSTATQPISKSGLQGAFRRALQLSGIAKKAAIHTLRHSYATHAPPLKLRRTSLLEAGVNLRQIQENLGHNSPKTTAVYTHLTSKGKQDAFEKLNSLMADI